MDFNKIKEMGLEYAEKGRNAAMDLAERGRTQAKIVSEQTKLARAQRQLGALVYSLAKGNEENQPLVDKYIEMIGSIEANLNALRESLGPAAEVITHDLDEEPAEGSGSSQVANTSSAVCAGFFCGFPGPPSSGWSTRSANARNATSGSPTTAPASACRRSPRWAPSSAST